jgi:hypothetical protein
VNPVKDPVDRWIVRALKPGRSSKNWKEEVVMNRISTGITAAFFIVSAFLARGTVFAEEDRLFEVTVTNITRGQVISPPLVISHNGDFELFQLGEPASEGLALLAEDGMPDGLVSLANASAEVFDVAVAGGGVVPGESVSVYIKIRGNFRHITTAGMLVTTNDAFFAVDGARIFNGGERVIMAYAYDAGSETNSESCAEIPGPPCENPLVRNITNAEGYVHIHSGIHGIGDLDPSLHDWRNPVARIAIRPAN